jgi:hypothetical protein
VFYTWVRNEGQVGWDAPAIAGVTKGPMEDDDCIRYLAASCKSVPSLRLQKCKAAGLDSIVPSNDTVEPSGAPISCWCSVTEGGTVERHDHQQRNKRKKGKTHTQHKSDLLPLPTHTPENSGYDIINIYYLSAVTRTQHGDELWRAQQRHIPKRASRYIFARLSLSLSLGSWRLSHETDDDCSGGWLGAFHYTWAASLY